MVHQGIGDSWDEIPSRARDLLIDDYSVPGVEALFEAAVEDARLTYGMGYAVAGLALLLPATVLWFRKLLTHRNHKVADEAAHMLATEDFVTFHGLLDTLDEIRASGKWREFKKHLIGVLKKTSPDFLLGRYRNAFKIIEQRHTRRQGQSPRQT